MKIGWQAEAPAPQDTQGLAQQGGTDAFVCQPQATAIFSQPAEVPLLCRFPHRLPVPLYVFDLGSYSSRVTFMAGNAAKSAAAKMRETILDAVARKTDTLPSDLTI